MVALPLTTAFNDIATTGAAWSCRVNDIATTGAATGAVTWRLQNRHALVKGASPDPGHTKLCLGARQIQHKNMHAG